MADDGRWWKKDEDTDTSKEDVEDMLNEACLLDTCDAADGLTRSDPHVTRPTQT